MAPPPLLLLEDGSARNRAMLVTLFFAVLLPNNPCPFHPWGKAGWLPIFPYCRLPRDTPASHFCHINLRSCSNAQLAPPPLELIGFSTELDRFPIIGDAKGIDGWIFKISSREIALCIFDPLIDRKILIERYFRKIVELSSNRFC